MDALLTHPGPAISAAPFEPSDPVAAALWFALVEDANLFVALYDVEGRIVYCNQRAAHFMSRPLEELHGRLLTEVVQGPFGAERMALVRRVATSPRPIMAVGSLGGLPIRETFRLLPAPPGVQPRVLSIRQEGAHAAECHLGESHYEVVHLEHNQPGQLALLTEREMEVLRMFAQGCTTDQIARRIFRTVKTVEWHRTVIGRKLGLHSRTELTRFAIQHGMVDVTEPGAAGSSIVQTESRPLQTHGAHPEH